jgi:hypothetical protein
MTVEVDRWCQAVGAYTTTAGDAILGWEKTVSEVSVSLGTDTKNILNNLYSIVE